MAHPLCHRAASYGATAIEKLHPMPYPSSDSAAGQSEPPALAWPQESGLVVARAPAVEQITSFYRKSCQAPREKLSSSVFQKNVVVSAHPDPDQRGVSRSSRTWEAGCGGR